MAKKYGLWVVAVLCLLIIEFYCLTDHTPVVTLSEAGRCESLITKALLDDPDLMSRFESQKSIEITQESVGAEKALTREFLGPIFTTETHVNLVQLVGSPDRITVVVTNSRGSVVVLSDGEYVKTMSD